MIDLELHAACFRQNWPQEFNALSTTLLHSAPVAPDVCDDMVQSRQAFGLCPIVEQPQFLKSGAFIKVAGFSFRGAPAFYVTEGKIDTLNAARLHLAHVPRRMSDAIAALVDAKMPVPLELYIHEEIPRWTEFRVFIQEGTLIGVSQYYTGERFPQIESHAAEIAQAISDLSAKLVENLHIDSVVADVIVNPAQPGHAARLLELNPFSTSTDPCLFNWRNGGDFDGGFRFFK